MSKMILEVLGEALGVSKKGDKSVDVEIPNVKNHT
jgi:hypothetical protein